MSPICLSGPAVAFPVPLLGPFAGSILSMTLLSVDGAGRHGDGVTDMPHADLRAALILRNSCGMPLDPTTEDPLAVASAQMNISRLDLIRMELREWLDARLAVSTSARELSSIPRSNQSTNCERTIWNSFPLVSVYGT